MDVSGSRKVVFAALAGNALIAITKFAAAAYTGSSAMLSEAIHSLVDTGDQGLLLYGMKRAARPGRQRFTRSVTASSSTSGRSSWRS